MVERLTASKYWVIEFESRLGLACSRALVITVCHLSHLQNSPLWFWGLNSATLKWLVSCQWRRVARTLGHCATNRKVAGSIPDEVLGFFSWLHPSSRSITQGPTQPLTINEYQEYSWGVKGGRRAMLTSLPSVSLDVSPLSASTACYRDTFTLYKYWDQFLRLCKYKWNH
jgi:hypothetical protein